MSEEIALFGEGPTPGGVDWRKISNALYYAGTCYESMHILKTNAEYGDIFMARKSWKVAMKDLEILDAVLNEKL